MQKKFLRTFKKHMLLIVFCVVHMAPPPCRAPFIPDYLHPDSYGTTHMRYEPDPPNPQGQAALNDCISKNPRVWKMIGCLLTIAGTVIGLTASGQTPPPASPTHPPGYCNLDNGITYCCSNGKVVISPNAWCSSGSGSGSFGQDCDVDVLNPGLETCQVGANCTCTPWLLRSPPPINGSRNITRTKFQKKLAQAAVIRETRQKTAGGKWGKH